MFKFLSILLGIVGVGGGIFTIVTDYLSIPMEVSVALVLGGIVLFIAAAIGAKRFAPLAGLAVAAAAIAVTVITFLESSGVLVPDIAKMIIVAVSAFAVYVASSFVAFALLCIIAFLFIWAFSQS